MCGWSNKKVKVAVRTIQYFYSYSSTRITRSGPTTAMSFSPASFKVPSNSDPSTPVVNGANPVSQQVARPGTVFLRADGLTKLSNNTRASKPPSRRH